MPPLLPPDGLALDLTAPAPGDPARRLEAAGVALNDAARELLAHPSLTTPPHGPRAVRLVERSLAELGLPRGGTLPRLKAAVRAAGLVPCPPLAAPLLRLRTLEQADAPDSVLRHGRAPAGSAHVLSPSLGEDPAVHRGFYLRAVDGVPWLRGFRCDDLHEFAPEDRWILTDPHRTA